MNNTIRSELYKIKKNKMAFIGGITTVFIPILLFLKSVTIDQTPLPFQEWIATVTMLVNIVLPVMSGFFITHSIQREYGEKTIINIITAPAKRSHFILAKLVVWFCWYLAVLVLTIVFTIAASCCLYQGEANTASTFWTIYVLALTNLLSFIAMVPILWVAVRQRALFYPSMLLTFIFVSIQAAGSQVSMELLPVASMVPWTAVTISGMLPANHLYFYICMISVMAAGLMGSIAAILEFRKQEL